MTECAHRTQDECHASAMTMFTAHKLIISAKKSHNKLKIFSPHNQWEDIVCRIGSVISVVKQERISVLNKQWWPS